MMNSFDDIQFKKKTSKIFNSEKSRKSQQKYFQKKINSNQKIF